MVVVSPVAGVGGAIIVVSVDVVVVKSVASAVVVVVAIGGVVDVVVVVGVSANVIVELVIAVELPTFKVALNAMQRAQ